MVQHESPQLAIYDECYANAQSMRNSLKRLGYTIQEISRNEEELLHFINRKPSVLLFHSDISIENTCNLLTKLKSKNSKLKILAHTVRREKDYREKLKANGASMVVDGSYDLNMLVEQLGKLDESFSVKPQTILDAGIIFNLSSTDPFYKIAADPKKLAITKLLSEGKSTKVIAQELDETENDIEVLRKKMLHDTNSKNVAAYVSMAKDKKIV